MIRQLLQSWLGTCDDYVERLQIEVSDLLDENVRLIGRVANLVAENKSLRMILLARDVEIAKLRKDFSDLVESRFTS